MKFSILIPALAIFAAATPALASTQGSPCASACGGTVQAVAVVQPALPPCACNGIVSAPIPALGGVGIAPVPHIGGIVAAPLPLLAAGVSAPIPKIGGLTSAPVPAIGGSLPSAPIPTAGYLPSAPIPAIGSNGGCMSCGGSMAIGNEGCPSTCAGGPSGYGVVVAQVPTGASAPTGSTAIPPTPPVKTHTTRFAPRVPNTGAGGDVATGLMLGGSLAVVFLGASVLVRRRAF